MSNSFVNKQKKTKQQERVERLALQLRSNLLKRKKKAPITIKDKKKR